MADARRVRLPRPPRSGPPRKLAVEASPVEGPPRTGGPAVERRVNRAATQREIRVTVLYVTGIAAVYACLAAIARVEPTGSAVGTSGDLLLFGLLAIVVAVAGGVVSLGAAPRAVELGETETVVVGRFGRRYRFPGRGQLHWTVLQRFPAGLLSSCALESVGIAGGTTRRSFLLDERLLDRSAPDEAGTEAAPR